VRYQARYIDGFIHIRSRAAALYMTEMVNFNYFYAHLFRAHLIILYIYIYRTSHRGVPI